MIHREWDGLVKERTALISRIRATLSEFGVVIPAGRSRFKNWFLAEYGKFEPKLPQLLQQHIVFMMNRLHQKESEIQRLETEIDRQSGSNAECKRLLEVPGIGRLTSSALVATVGDAKAFKSGRQLSAWLGIVPKQYSSGGKQILQGISKRGDVYLRRLLIHGARAVIRHSKLGSPWYNWIQSLESRMHKNKVIVALANKLARIAWVHGALDFDQVNCSLVSIRSESRLYQSAKGSVLSSINRIYSLF